MDDNNDPTWKGIEALRFHVASSPRGIIFLIRIYQTRFYPSPVDDDLITRPRLELYTLDYLTISTIPITFYSYQHHHPLHLSPCQSHTRIISISHHPIMKCTRMTSFPPVQADNDPLQPEVSSRTHSEDLLKLETTHLSPQPPTLNVKPQSSSSLVPRMNGSRLTIQPQMG